MTFRIGNLPFNTDEVIWDINKLKNNLITVSGETSATYLYIIGKMAEISGSLHQDDLNLYNYFYSLIGSTSSNLMNYDDEIYSSLYTTISSTSSTLHQDDLNISSSLYATISSVSSQLHQDDLNVSGYAYALMESTSSNLMDEIDIVNLYVIDVENSLSGKSSVILDSSRLISGGNVEMVDSNIIAISAGLGQIRNYAQDLVMVSWNNIPSYSLSSYINSGYDASYVLIDVNGNIVISTTNPLDGTLKNHVYISKVAHRSGGAITNIRNFKHYGEEIMQEIRELAYAMGPLTMQGNVFSSLSGLVIQKNEGISFRHNINADVDRSNPNFVVDPSRNSLEHPFVYCYRKLGGGITYVPANTVIAPGSYDSTPGTLGSVGNNDYTIQRIYHFPRTNSIYVFYGRTIHATMAVALDAISTEEFELDTDFFDGAVLRAYLVLKGNATNLSDSGQARFVSTGKFSGAGGTGAPASLYIDDSITDGIIDRAPSQNAVFDALNLINNSVSGGLSAIELDLENLSSTIYNGWNDAKNPTGFVDPSNIMVSYNSSERTITLTHNSGTIYYYYRGILKSLSSPWVSIPHDDSTGRWYLKSSDGNSFIWDNEIWDFYDIQVSYVYYDSGNVSLRLAARETHGLMPWQCHQNDHFNVGCWRQAGTGTLSANTFAIQPGSPTDIDNTPGVNTSTLHDEDLTTIIPALTEGSYTVHYLNNSSSSNFIIGNSLPFRHGGTGTYLYYNPLIGGVYTDTSVPNNSFVNLYLIALPVASDNSSQNFRYVWQMGHYVYGTLAAARSESSISLNLGELANFSHEINMVAQITIGTKNAYGSSGKCGIESVTYITGNAKSTINVTGFVPTNHGLLLGRSDVSQHPALSIDVDAVGSLSADNLQNTLSGIDARINGCSEIEVPINISINGGTNYITTGAKNSYLTIPYDATIQSWSIVGDTSGSIIIDIWKTNANIPTIVDTITGSNKPTLSSQVFNNGNVNTWTTTLSTNDVIGINVDSVSLLKSAALCVLIKKN